ncbi:MAG TPA: hypothetical protein VLH75_10290 [Longimicrobiales bacterium]|nr:hypothetical protein [Longimicrobiales bacterium]
MSREGWTRVRYHLALAALAATLGVSTQGYRALTLEEVAATITTVPTGPRAFQAF